MALTDNTRRVLPGFDAIPDGTPLADDPYLLLDYDSLLAHCEAALARRQESYPKLIARSELAADEAQADITAWTLLAQEWRWIISGEGQCPPPWTLFDRIEAVDLALQRVEKAIERQGLTADLRHQLGCNQALRWHLGHLKYGDPAVHFYAAATHAARAAAVVQVCPACELRRADPATRSCTRTDCGLALRAVPGAANLADQLKEQAA